MAASSPAGDLYRDYRELIERDVLPRSLRTGTFVFFVIQTVFIYVDWLMFRENFWNFLPVRVGLDAAFALIYFKTCWVRPLASTVAVCWLGGAMLLMVTAGTGGGSSGYYVGLVLLFVGVGTLVPLTTRQASGILGMLYGAYVGVGLLAKPIVWEEFGLHLFFLGAAGFAGAMSCGLLDRMRFNDFLQRREIEEARDKLASLDREKSRFTANIHHELRTPLTLMLAPIEAMRSGDLGEVPSGLDRTLRTMQSNGLRLLKLINNLLDLAKIESQQLSVRRVPVDLTQLVGEVVDGATPMADRKGLWLRQEGFGEFPTFHLDPDALEKILVNLIGNALKFTDAGGITVRASALPAGGEEGELAQGGVHLTVEDTGVGIPEGQLGRVFDRFAQVDGSATRKHEGTGIGLSLVHELVSLHGGRVWATSAGEGQGSEMHVLLPLGEPDDAPDEEVMLEESGGRALSASKSFEALASEVSMDLEGSEQSRFAAVEHTVSRWEATRHGDDWLAELPQHPPGTPRVVVAEDNSEMCRLLAFLVGREFVVQPCRNGREALEAVRESPPELVLTDVMMPEMSGTELCRAIKEDDALSAVPVMLVTSKAEREMKIEGLELGADDYVTKPFHPRELMARARSLVRIRSLQHQLAGRNDELERSNRDLEQAMDELKAAEVQLVHAERLAAVGELSAGVAHEVNTPLNFARNSLAALRTYVDDLRGLASLIGGLDAEDPKRLRVQLLQLERKKQELCFDELATDLAELVGIVTEGLDRTARLVADLRDFAAPGREGQALVDVEAGLRSTLQLMAHRFREAGIEVEVEFSPGLEPVPGDPGGLNQVFLNLLKNAAEAIEGQSGSILVRARKVEDGGGAHLEVSVQDSGSGIDAAIQERLFEPFFTTKEAGRGTGLGLALCQRVMAEHGGSIEIASTPGEGTCATICLPLAGSTEAADHGRE